MSKEKEQCVETERVLVSIGRRANTEGICPPSLNLQMQRGMIPVDDSFETCIKGIYAIGDIVLGGIQLAMWLPPRQSTRCAPCLGKGHP